MSRTAEAPSQPPARTGSRLIRAVLAVLGGLMLVGAEWLLLGVVYFNGGPPGGGVPAFVLLWAVMVMPIVGWLWRSRSSAPRWFAVGWSLGFVVPVALWIASPGGYPPDPDSPAQVEARLGRYQAQSSYTVYYLGRRFEHWPLVDALKERRTGEVDEMYGPCRDNGDGTCSEPLDVLNTPSDLIGGSGCRLLPPMRGVPAMYLSGVVLYTGTSSIQISDGSRESELAAVRALRPVGARQTSGDLPPPAPDVMTRLKKVCKVAAPR